MSVLKMLWKIVEIIIAIIRRGPSGASTGASLPEPPVTTPPVEEHTTTPEVTPPVVVEATPAVPVSVPTPPPGKDPNRRGTFLITDIYPLDLGPNPPWQVLPNRVVDGKEVVGAIIKCSQGLSWGATNEDWFRRNWRKVKEVGGAGYGTDWFRGCYHFLSFRRDGAKQADYFCNLVEQAGGWDVGDIMPMVDAEEGGQGDWAGGEKLEAIKDPAKRKRLADEVIECTTKFVDRVKQRTGLRVLLYGRGVMRDLQINDRMHADAVCNPAYTKAMPPMDKYGWPLKDIVLWQLCGDGEVFVPGFPKVLHPQWDTQDYSVYIDGANKTDLDSLRKRILAKPR